MASKKQKTQEEIKVSLYNQEGKAVGEVVLPDEIFGLEVNPNLLNQAITAQMANSREVYTHTKNRGEVRGGGRKPRPQKHGGQSRQGSTRSPQWRHGGIVFGPTNERVFSKKINREMKRKALLMALSSKVGDKEIVAVENLKLAATKTKEAVGVLKKLPIDNTVLIVMPATDQILLKSMRNIPSVSIIKADSLNVLDVLNNKYLMLFKDSIEIIKKTYGVKETK